MRCNETGAIPEAITLKNNSRLSLWSVCISFKRGIAHTFEHTGLENSNVKIVWTNTSSAFNVECITAVGLNMLPYYNLNKKVRGWPG